MTTEEPSAKKLTASQRIALAMGRPMPKRMIKKEIRKLKAQLRREDADTARFYAEDSDSVAS